MEYVTILDSPNAIGTAYIPMLFIIIIRNAMFMMLPAMYEMLIYFVSRLMLIPDVATGKSKCIHIGMHNIVKYLLASMYELLLNNKTISFDINETDTAIIVSMSTIAVYSLLISLRKPSFL